MSVPALRVGVPVDGPGGGELGWGWERSRWSLETDKVAAIYDEFEVGEGL